jgi:hypothetical protein
MSNEFRSNRMLCDFHGFMLLIRGTNGEVDNQDFDFKHRYIYFVDNYRYVAWSSGWLIEFVIMRELVTEITNAFW